MPLDLGIDQNTTRSVDHLQQRRAFGSKKPSLPGNNNVHFNIQFDAPPDLVELSHPPMQPLPTAAYVNNIKGAGKGVTIYTFDSGFNTESDVSTVH